MTFTSRLIYVALLLGVSVSSASAEKYYCQHNTAVTEGRVRAAVVRAYKNAGFRSATAKLSPSSRVALRFSPYNGVSPVPNLADSFAVGVSGELLIHADKLQSQISSRSCSTEAQLELSVTAVKEKAIIKDTKTVTVRLEGTVRACHEGVARPGCR